MRQAFLTNLTALLVLAGTPTIQAGIADMNKHVTEQASFVLYLPDGWQATEGVIPGARTLSISDPAGECGAALCYGFSLVGDNAELLARNLAGGLGQKYANLEIVKSYGSRDGAKVAFDATYGHPKKGNGELRCWVTVQGGYFSCSSIEAPTGKLDSQRELLLTILSNVRLTKGSMEFQGGTLVPVASLATHRLADGSASVDLPQGWQTRDLGTGTFVAASPDGSSSFIVSSAEVLSPRLGVQVPNALMSDYLPPHKALELAATQARLASDMRFVEIIRRKDLTDQISQVYTVGPVQVEEFVQTSTSRKGEKTKGYSLGVSFGSRLGTNWRFWHMTVTASADKFDATVPTFAAMMQSYRMNDQFAANHIAHGMARLREMQQQTAALVARNAQEIHNMMQEAYQERQRSWDYIDYQRTNYIRGQQDWISSMEGGAVYHTDNWGTLNTDTGIYREGKAYDYVHFTGENPKYLEQMTPIDSRSLLERHIAR